MGRKDDRISSKLESVLLPTLFFFYLQYRTLWILHHGISSIYQYNIALSDRTPANIRQHSRLDPHGMSSKWCSWSYSFVLVRTGMFGLREGDKYDFFSQSLSISSFHFVGVGWKQWLSCIWISHECDSRSFLSFAGKLDHIHGRSKIVRILS